MVSREDLEGEEQASGSGGTSSEGTVKGSMGRTPQPREDPRIEGFQKCPYLAGRPPCGTHHMFPSGANVCYACPSENKPYRSQSRQTQELHCFGGTEGVAGCEPYQRAVAEALPLPRFDQPWTGKLAGEAGTRPAHRPPLFRAGKPGARWMFYVSWMAPLLLSLVLLAMWLR
jgi:hypothetical protein